MTFEEAYKLFKNKTSAMCAYFNVTKQSVQQWKKSNKLPLLRQLQLKEKLNEHSTSEIHSSEQ
jgi:hypothetical protein